MRACKGDMLSNALCLKRIQSLILRSVVVKQVLGHRARRGDPKSLMFRARHARNIKGFSVSKIHANSNQRKAFLCDTKKCQNQPYVLTDKPLKLPALKLAIAKAFIF